MWIGSGGADARGAAQSPVLSDACSSQRSRSKLLLDECIDTLRSCKGNKSYVTKRDGLNSKTGSSNSPMIAAFHLENAKASAVKPQSTKTIVRGSKKRGLGEGVREDRNVLFSPRLTATDDPKSKIFVCKERNCGKIFDRRYNRDAHSRKHTGETPYHCAEVDGNTGRTCTEKFRWRSSLRNHFLSAHNEKEIENRLEVVQTPAADLHHLSRSGSVSARKKPVPAAMPIHRAVSIRNAAIVKKMKSRKTPCFKKRDTNGSTLSERNSIKACRNFAANTRLLSSGQLPPKSNLVAKGTDANVKTAHVLSTVPCPPTSNHQNPFHMCSLGNGLDMPMVHDAWLEMFPNVEDPATLQSIPPDGVQMVWESAEEDPAMVARPPTTATEFTKILGPDYAEDPV